MTDRLAAYLAVLQRDGQPIAAGARLVSGQFHDVVLAGEVAYRFPRDERSRQQLPARMAMLAALARARLPVSIPVPLDSAYLGRPLGTCYATVSLVHGEPADHGEPAGRGPPRGQAAQTALARGLADLLDKLAVLGADESIRRVVCAATSDHWVRWAGQVRHVLFPLMTPAGRERAQAELAAVSAIDPTGSALVHTDLGGSNLLLTAAGDIRTLTGLLDWDEAQIANQANDLASIAATFGWRLAGRVDAERARSSGPMVEAARVIAATFALQQALPAALSGDTDSLADGLCPYR